MGLLILASLLFLAMLAAWVVLPGSMIASITEEHAEPMSTSVASQTA